MLECLTDAGCFISGATEAIAPADAILYQQRDVTNTVGSPPLIVSSILSKKFAEGTRALVMDIKVGEATFLKNLDEATPTAELMVCSVETFTPLYLHIFYRWIFQKDWEF